MRKYLFGLIFILLFCSLSRAEQISAGSSAGISRQPQDTTVNNSISLDSLRKREESRIDSVVPTAKYIRYTTLAMLKDSTHTLQIDTTLINFQHYNPLNRPENPSINLGATGLAYRDLLFQPARSIGFNVGFHVLDRYLLRTDSVKYYTARSPYTELYYVSGKTQEQTFRVIHTQNIKPNWNVGVNYNRIGGDGFYINQNVDHLNAALFTWYQGPKKRYQLMAHALFNNIKAGENGSTVREDIFEGEKSLASDAEFVRLSATGETRPKQTWRENTVFLKQTYDIGHRDSIKTTDANASLLPTQRLSYSIAYTKNLYKFFRNEPDTYLVFPHPQPETLTLTRDTTEISHLSNEFTYSFYLRGRAVSFLRNELKLDLGAQHDLYQYIQMGEQKENQNISLKAGLGYRFNESVNLTAKLEQIAQGSQAGDYLYDAKTQILLSKSVGRIILGAYLQNKSPEEIFNRMNYQFHQWSFDFKRTKTNNLSFKYENPAFHFYVQAEYLRMMNYLYFQETDIAKEIKPQQLDADLNMLKITLAKHFKLGRFNLQHLSVYQKSSEQEVLATPEFYTYNSFYYDCNLFKVLHANIGFDIKYHTEFNNPAYAIDAGQFYNQKTPVKYPTYPVVDVFIKATLKRANLFLKYDYMNQGWQSKGYYTVDRYPMPNRLLKFGLSWKFYN
ncbi:MAG: putative porin [Sphingobacteriaceae bacterium]